MVRHVHCVAVVRTALVARQPVALRAIRRTRILMQVPHRQVLATKMVQKQVRRSMAVFRQTVTA